MQVHLNQARPVTNNAGVRASHHSMISMISSLNQQQQQQTIGPSKETSIPRSVQTHTPVTVQSVPTVASSISKQVPGKANVIVLHKNLPVTKTITTVARVSSVFKQSLVVLLQTRNDILWSIT